jgi:transcriptional regulator with XRE-family HTH domain
VDLRDVRTQLRIGIDEAADGIGVNKSVLSRIEQRQRGPSGAVLLMIDEWVSELRHKRNLPADFRVDWSYLVKTLRARRRRRRREAAE